MKRAWFALLLASPLVLGAGWGVDSYSSGQSTVERVEAMQGRPFDIYAVYDNLDQGAAFPNQDALDAMARGATIYLNITSTHVVETGEEVYTKLPYCWAGVGSGRRDDLLKAWTEAIHATGYDRYIVTFAHEPTGGDNEHAPKCDRNTPADYRAAFTRVVTFFHGHNVFAPWAFISILRHFDTPGLVDPYVPWGSFSIVGGDTYDHLDNWRTPAEMFGSFVEWRAQNCPDLPVLIGEFGVDTRHPDAAQLVTDTAAYLEATFGTALLGLVQNVQNPWNVYTAESRDAFVAASRSGYYGGGG